MREGGFPCRAAISELSVFALSPALHGSRLEDSARMVVATRKEDRRGAQAFDTGRREDAIAWEIRTAD